VSILLGSSVTFVVPFPPLNLRPIFVVSTRLSYGSILMEPARALLRAGGLHYYLVLRS
jgi:hypothetical protein